MDRYVRKLHISFDEPQDPEHLKYSEGILNLLDWDEEGLNDEQLMRKSSRKGARKRARNRLASFLSGNWTTGRLVHNCQLGCCANGAESRQKLHDYIMDTFMANLPAIPALNRWTKLYPSLAWWTVALHMHGMIKSLWGMMYKFDSNHEPAAVVMDLLEPGDDEVQRKLNAARARKTWRWLLHKKTPSELLVACLVLRPCMSFMGFLFRSEASAAAHSVKLLLVKDSPAIRTVKYLFAMLLDLRNDFWFLFSFGEGWTEIRLQLAANAVFRLRASGQMCSDESTKGGGGVAGLVHRLLPSLASAHEKCDI